MDSILTCGLPNPGIALDPVMTAGSESYLLSFLFLSHSKKNADTVCIASTTRGILFQVAIRLDGNGSAAALDGNQLRLGLVHLKTGILPPLGFRSVALQLGGLPRSIGHLRLLFYPRPSGHSTVGAIPAGQPRAGLARARVTTDGSEFNDLFSSSNALNTHSLQ